MDTLNIAEKLEYLSEANTHLEFITNKDKFEELLAEILLADDLYDIEDTMPMDYLSNILNSGFKGYSNMTGDELLKELLNRNIVFDIEQDEFLNNLERIEDYLTHKPEHIINTLNSIIKV